MDDRRLKTARVRWRMGQPLLPEHFYCQEESLRSEVDLRFDLAPSPQWGVGEMVWEVSVEGRVRIIRMVLIRPDGAVVDVPGNCDAPAAIELGDEGLSEVPLYLHFEGGSRYTKENPLGETDNVERTVLQVKLSIHPSSDPDAEPFKLAAFAKSVEDEWDLDASFIPPCTRVAALPYFTGILRRLRTLVAQLHQTLVEETRDAFLSAETITSARQCLRGVFGMQALLADLGADLDLHPGELWQAMTRLYLDICVHRGITPTAHTLAYRHRELGEAFGKLLAALEAQVTIRRTETPHATFGREGNVFVCQLPPDVRRAKQIFWLVQKERVGDSIPRNQVKLASPQRLPTVHQLALRGVAFEPMPNPPFHHNFTSEVEFFSLTRGEEWDHALREGALAFYARGELDKIRAFLYWRDED